MQRDRVGRAFHRLSDIPKKWQECLSSYRTPKEKPKPSKPSVRCPGAARLGMKELFSFYLCNIFRKSASASSIAFRFANPEKYSSEMLHNVEGFFICWSSLIFPSLCRPCNKKGFFSILSPQTKWYNMLLTQGLCLLLGFLYEINCDQSIMSIPRTYIAAVEITM